MVTILPLCRDGRFLPFLASWLRRRALLDLAIESRIFHTLAKQTFPGSCTQAGQGASSNVTALSHIPVWFLLAFYPCCQPRTSKLRRERDSLPNCVPFLRHLQVQDYLCAPHPTHFHLPRNSGVILPHKIFLSTQSFFSISQAPL